MEDNDRDKEDVTIAALGRSFFEQIDRFHQYSCRHDICLNMNRGEVMMLTLLEHLTKKDSEVRSSELTGGGVMSKPAVSRMLGNLEEKGYVNRKVSRSDRRVVYVQLTESGKRTLEEERRHRDQMMERVVARMGVDKMQQFLMMAEEFMKYAKEEMAGLKKTGEQKENRHYDKNS